MKTEPTPVIFRTYRNGGDVIALFPFEPHDREGRYCMSYQHVGQHGAADPYACRETTRPSTSAEIATLGLELRDRGYHLKLLSRMPANAIAVRRRAITAMYGRAAVS